MKLVCIILFLSLKLAHAQADFHREHHLKEGLMHEREKHQVTSSKNMVEFNLKTGLGGSLALAKRHEKGRGEDEEFESELSLNYAYAITNFIQLGTRLQYSNQAVAKSSQERMDAQIGAIVNSREELTEAWYVSIYLGAGILNSTSPSQKDDLRLGTLALGKRISLQPIGIKHFSYTPELAWTSLTSTQGKAFNYHQEFALRILQFSLFF